MIPVGSDIELPMMGLFLDVLTEKFTPKEEQALAKSLGFEKADLDQWHKLDARAKKLEKDLKSASTKPSQLYLAVSKACGDLILYLLLNSKERIVQDRIKNFFGKYLPMAEKFVNKYDWEFKWQKDLWLDLWKTQAVQDKCLEYWRAFRHLDDIRSIINFNEHTNVLDVGCGLSSVLHYLPGKRVGVDPLADRYKAIYKYPFEVVLANGEQLPFAPRILRRCIFIEFH